jgi:hypothetical protein
VTCWTTWVQRTLVAAAAAAAVASAAVAVTPPGHFTAGGKTEICPAGSWRADWAPVGVATACNACGDGVFAERSDVVIKYDPVTYAATQVFVSTAADDCCKSGWAPGGGGCEGQWGWWELHE